MKTEFTVSHRSSQTSAEGFWAKPINAGIVKTTRYKSISRFPASTSPCGPTGKFHTLQCNDPAHAHAGSLAHCS